MSTANVSFFNLASDRLSWLAARQKVTAENIANANTPGFQAQDVTNFSEMLKDSRMGLTQTHPAHQPGSRPGSVAGLREISDPTAVAQSLDGNNVNLEQQAVRSVDIGDQHRLASELYRKGYEMLSLAVRRG